MARGLRALTVLAALLVPGQALAAPVKFHDAAGISVQSVRALDPRLLALTVRTQALGAPAKVRILLPSGYAANPHSRYPVLYLLHGTSGGAADWTQKGGAERTTAGRPLIVVMPDIALDYDGGGWCTNWYNGGAWGRPEWETFHVAQLIPWIDRNLRTVASRAGRAIAGLSQGGFCSMSYAARHPDLFITALSFSGAPDIAYDAEAQTLVTPVINATETFLDHVPPNSMFGPRTSEEINWAAHDPTTLAANLRGMNLLMFTGNGQLGPYDSGPNPGAQGIEAGVEQLTRLFHNRLMALRIPSFYDDYGPGTHTWPYWARDLRQSIRPLMADFAHAPPPPARFSYKSAEARYRIYGWRVTVRRKVKEFSTLANTGAGGFTLAGSGSAAVITPATYVPGATYRITLRSRSGTHRQLIRASPDGRLRIEVPLGPSNTVQEYPGDGPPVGTAVYRTRVTIERWSG